MRTENAASTTSVTTSHSARRFVMGGLPVRAVPRQHAARWVEWPQRLSDWLGVVMPPDTFWCALRGAPGASFGGDCTLPPGDCNDYLSHNKRKSSPDGARTPPLGP